MHKLFIGLSTLVVLAACSSAPAKKVVVMASGKLDVTGETINYEAGTQHNEATVTLTGDKLVVKSGAASKEYSVPSAGTWLLNLQNDTLIGGYQSFGDAASREAKITQDQLQQRMDSLQQLMVGSNISAAKKNFFLAPQDLKLISTADNAILVGPFKGMPASLQPDKDGNVPEVYKFVSNKDARETLNRLEKLLKQ
ncbi:hypothetical protein [Flavihumibacter fluvii]|uniref:hypothetical protein n=1 Tax=Flavihumibacter fluvii TaxID=2838157 RepID=UPI001BDE63B4|nr:hypothetical protein [Flavihumibacter fluvii]ULQ52277.1 hypothetical protein KJS93_19495 [Flavihumibacter fluvii]